MSTSSLSPGWQVYEETPERKPAAQSPNSALPGRRRNVGSVRSFLCLCWFARPLRIYRSYIRRPIARQRIWAMQLGRQRRRVFPIGRTSAAREQLFTFLYLRRKWA